jgi:hypothetical protein
MFSAVSRIVVIGDVHGDLDRVIKCLRVAKVINNANEWIAEPSDTYVVQMGDQLDSANRANFGEWETVPDIALMEFMDTLDRVARLHGGRVISLLGNHEIMNMAGDYTYVSANSMRLTGGPQNRNALFGKDGVGAHMLGNRYVVAKIGSFLFCHAGLLPCHLNLVGEHIDDLNTTFWAVIRGDNLTSKQQDIFTKLILDNNGILWTRKYHELAVASVTDPAALDQLHSYVYIVLRTTGCTSMFLGHNTVPSTSVVESGALIFTDACFSRAYGQNKYQYIDIKGEQLNVVEVNETKNEEV